jgi:two-component system cell cycle response regulator CtrA
MRVLLIEDDTSTAFSIELMLRSDNIQCDTANYGEEGINRCKLDKVYDYDLIILDLMLPDVGGLDVVKTIRKAKIKTPILILSGLKELDKKITGINSGADDYLTKPFNKDELITRIKAIVRRSYGHPESVIRTGVLSIDLRTHHVKINDVRIHLTGKEYMILELLALRKGSTLTKEMFLNHLYGGLDEPELKIIDVFICKLRRKLEKLLPKGDKYIDTVWGRGYVLRDIPLEDEKEEGISTTDSAKIDKYIAKSGS